MIQHLWAYLEVHGTYYPIITVRTTVLRTRPGHLRGYRWVRSTVIFG